MKEQMIPNYSSTNVIVKHVNKPPIANAGTNQTVNSGDRVTLDGRGSRDPDGNVTSYSWTQTAGPNVGLNGSNTVRAFFKAPSLSSSTTLRFSLSVTDNKGARSNNHAIVTISVHPYALNKYGFALFLRMGSALNNLGNYTQAIPYLDKALAIDPNDKLALEEKGVDLDNLGNYTQAIPYLDKALAIDPNYKFALAEKGSALNNLGNYTQAIPYLDKALAIDPNYKFALEEKGSALNNLGNYTQAIPYLDKALSYRSK